MFDTDADLERADWPLLQNGAVNLFHRPEHFSAAQAALRALDYEVATVTCLDGQTAFEHQISSRLNWKRQFGYEPWRGNLDALSDGLSGYPFGPARRAALAVESFHVLVAADRNRARNTLDLIESAARDHLLWGKTLIALIQTDDPDYHCVGIGGRAATWNRKEWLKAERIS